MYCKALVTKKRMTYEQQIVFKIKKERKKETKQFNNNKKQIITI